MSPPAASMLCLLIICPALRAETVACPPHTSHISVASGTFSSQPGVTFELRHFVATLVPLGKTAPACYGKMTVVSAAEIFVSNESLSTIFSEKLAASDSKIKNFKVANGLEQATLSGRISHIIPIDFSIAGPVTTNGTEIRLEAQKIKADGVPVKALLQLVGEHLNSVLQLRGVSGVTIEGNSLSFSPEKVAHLRGHIVGVKTSPEGLTLRYGSIPLERHGHTSARNVGSLSPP